MIKLDLNPAPHIIKQFAWFAVIGMGLLGMVALKFTVGFEWDHPVFLGAVGIGVLQLLLFLVGVEFLSRALFIGLSVAFVPIGFVLSCFRVTDSNSFLILLAPVSRSLSVSVTSLVSEARASTRTIVKTRKSRPD